MSPTFRGLRHIIQWASKFTRKLVESSLGGEVYAFSEMPDHMSMIREFRQLFFDLAPGMVGLVNCESLFAQLENRKPLAAKFLVRYLSSFQHALGMWGLDNAY